MIKKMMHLCIFLLAGLSLGLAFSLKASADEGFSVPASAAFAVDYDSGKVLYNQNGEEPLAIASMTKLLTAYIVLEEIKNNRLSWEDTVPIRDTLKDLSQNPDLSNVPLNDMQTFTVKDALYGSLIASANSLTSALAEMISGSEISFVDRMYEQLHSWGIEDASLVSASGLGNEDVGREDLYPGTSKTDENMLSARDMAIIGRHIIEDFPEVLNITSQPSATILENTDQETIIENSNKMLVGNDYYKEGVDGLKTGTTDLAGDCFIGTATKGDQRIITVIMHVNDGKNRFEETSKLMDYAFDSWSLSKVAEKGSIASEKEIAVKNGQNKYADLILDDDLFIWTTASSDIAYDFEPNEEVVNSNQELLAPMNKNAIIGQQKIYDKNDALGFLETDDEKPESVNVVLKDSIKKENFFMQVWHGILKKINLF